MWSKARRTYRSVRVPCHTMLRSLGVYQPLLNWYGYRARQRVADSQSRAAAAVIRSMATDLASASTGAADSSVQDPTATVRLLLPSMLRSGIGSRIANAMSQHIQQSGRSPTAADWQKLLTTDTLQQFLGATQVTQTVRWPAMQGTGVPTVAGSSNLAELAAADFFRWAALHAPNMLNVLFLTATPPWKTSLAFVDPFAGAPDTYHGVTTNTQGRIPTGILSPVGLINLYREYFFELDTFLGPPVGHVWVSPGGSLELYEASTRSTTVTQTTEMSTTQTAKDETDTTDQDELSDAVKTDNKNDTKIGASVNAGGSFLGIVHADAQAGFNTDSSVDSSNEEAHKHSRTQSEKLSKEITQTYKTTFQTVTATTDTTSRRYVLSNNTTSLANYELRRKLRLIGVQLQHIGTRLSWQTFVPSPASLLGVGEFLPAPPDNSAAAAIQPPAPWDPPKPQEVPLTVEFPAMPILETDTGSQDGMLGSSYRHTGADPTAGGAGDPFAVLGLDSYGNDLHLHSQYQYCGTPPGVGYTLTGVRINKTDTTTWCVTRIDDAAAGLFTIHFFYIHNFGPQGAVVIDLALQWTPPPPAKDPTKQAYDAAFAEYQSQLAAANLLDYVNATRARVKTISGITPRPGADLRDEERDAIYRQLYQQLTSVGFADQYVTAEYVRELFDVDNMLYYVEPDYYLPRALGPTPGFGGSGSPSPADQLAGSTVSSWPRRPGTDYYLITEDSQPAPKGSSLGWTIQLDGDERRNEFLNASWIKAVIPVKPGREVDALGWLQNENVEGSDGLADPYIPQPGDPATYVGTVGEVLTMMATDLAAKNADIMNTLATETVFEAGFDPLANGIKLDPTVDFKRNAGPYQMFDFWLEVMPTDQVVAVDYDPTKHGA